MVLALISIVGYFVLSQYPVTPNQNHITQSDALPEIDIPSLIDACESPISEWITYIDTEDVGFEIKFPPFTCDYFDGQIIKNSVAFEVFRDENKDMSAMVFYDGHEFALTSIGFQKAPTKTLQDIYERWRVYHPIDDEYEKIIAVNSFEINQLPILEVVEWSAENTYTAQYFAKVGDYILDKEITVENISSLDYFRENLEWKILSTVRSYLNNE
jgi:hypothetical protein